jgi:uncharacterized protein (TIGR02001 family)
MRIVWRVCGGALTSLLTNCIGDNMKRLLGIVLLVSAGSAAAAEFSGNVTLATDYRFRGISQLDRSPAIQGGFDLATESGFYIGTWASNVNFSEGAIELDVYGGFAGQFNENMGYDVGLLYYGYPHDGTGAVDLPYWELYTKFTFWDATVGLHYSPDYFAETDSFWYLFGDYSVGLGENFSLDFHGGFNKFEDDDAGASFGIGGNGGDDQYFDYSIGVSTSALGLDFSLAWVGTDLDDNECFGGTKLCEDTAVFSVSKSL